MSNIAQDVEATSRDTSITVWAIAGVVMIGSAVSAGFLFHFLGEHFAIGVLIALAVDLALAAWLRASNRLKALGVKSEIGLTLEVVAALMTLFINVGAALAPLVPEHSPMARGVLAIVHGFLPVVMVLVSLAGGDAYLKLRRVRDQETAREKAARDAEAERQRSEWESEQRRVKTEQAEREARIERERKDAQRARELENSRHEREVADRREARAHQEMLSVRGLAAALMMGATMRAAADRDAESRVSAGRESGVRTMASALLVSAVLRGSRQRRASHSRQPSPPGSPARVASSSPADRQLVASGRRQPASPAATKRSPAATPDFDRLVTLAKELLAREPGMGRPTLAKQLANATGTKITDHMVKKVLAAIQEEREARFQAELESVLGGNQERD